MRGRAPPNSLCKKLLATQYPTGLLQKAGCTGQLISRESFRPVKDETLVLLVERFPIQWAAPISDPQRAMHSMIS